MRRRTVNEHAIADHADWPLVMDELEQLHLIVLANFLGTAQTTNSSRASTIFGLSKDFSITAATVGTNAAILPHPQQICPPSPSAVCRC